MKKIILFIITILLLSSVIAMTNPRPLFLKDPSSPSSDAKILSTVGKTLEEEFAGTQMFLNSQSVTREYLSNTIALFPYYGKALVVIGEDASDEHVDLAYMIIDVLEQEGIDHIVKKTNELTSDDLTIEVELEQLNCVDSDEGNHYVKGTLKINGEKKGEDVCMSIVNDIWTDLDEGTHVREYFCFPESISTGYAEAYAECSNGCKDGACIEETVPEPELISEPVPEPISEPELISEPTPEPECSYMGYIEDEQYCDITGKFQNQKDKGESCENNFECKTNSCIDNECVKLGFFKSIIEWFKNLF